MPAGRFAILLLLLQNLGLQDPNFPDRDYMIINLHGFNSSGHNNTAEQLRQYFEPDIDVLSPTYTVYNFDRGEADLDEAVATAIADSDARTLLFLGSSTGALFAEMLAGKYGGAVVVINPVTDPVILQGALGLNRNYRTDEAYHFTRDDLDSFEHVKHDMSIPRLVLVERNDPVIDHRLTRKFYEAHSRYIEYQGDSHRFTFFEQALPEIRKLYFGK